MGAHGAARPTKYNSIHEIPDEFVIRHSKRDPDNKLYETRRWVNFKKTQIFQQQQDGVPTYKRTLLGRCSYYGLWTASLGMLCYNLYLLNKNVNKKKS